MYVFYVCMYFMHVLNACMYVIKACIYIYIYIYIYKCIYMCVCVCVCLYAMYNYVPMHACMFCARNVNIDRSACVWVLHGSSCVATEIAGTYIHFKIYTLQHDIPFTFDFKIYIFYTEL